MVPLPGVPTPCPVRSCGGGPEEAGARPMGGRSVRGRRGGRGFALRLRPVRRAMTDPAGEYRAPRPHSERREIPVSIEEIASEAAQSCFIEEFRTDENLGERKELG